MKKSPNQPADQSLNQEINQPINQSVNEQVNQVRNWTTNYNVTQQISDSGVKLECSSGIAANSKRHGGHGCGACLTVPAATCAHCIFHDTAHVVEQKSLWGRYLNTWVPIGHTFNKGNCAHNELLSSPFPFNIFHRVNQVDCSSTMPCCWTEPFANCGASNGVFNASYENV